MAERLHFNSPSVLGCGNMGAALVRGICASGGWDASRVRVYDVQQDLSAALARETGVDDVSGLEEAVRGADAIIAAVKPQVFPDIASSVTHAARENAVLISIMAGLSPDKIRSLVGAKVRVVRTMPNLPLSVSSGVTAIDTDGHPEELIQAVEEIFSPVGKTLRVRGEQMDAVTGLSGSGPMYLFEFIDGLVSGGVRSGLERDAAHFLAAQTIKGALKLLESGSETPVEWTRKVCSPGGTTLAALDVLNKSQFKEIIRTAVEAAVARSRELGS